MKKVLLLFFVATAAFTNLIAQPLLLANAGPDQQGCAGQGSFLSGSATGGIPPYTYQWTPSNQVVNPNLSSSWTYNLGLGVHTYVLTITDSVGTIDSDIVIINVQMSPSIAFIDSATSSCSSADGSIHTVVTGGSPPYTYAWSNGATTQNLTGLPAGIYSITITDANGCNVYQNVFVNAGPGNLTAVVFSDTIDCSNPVSNTTLTISNGSPPYFVNWYDGTYDSSATNVLHHAYNPMSWQEWVYAIQYSDSSGCSYTIYDTVYNNGLIPWLTTEGQPSCSQPTAGKLRATGLYGTPPYFYQWSTGSTADTIINLCAGTYSYTVTDSTGCSRSLSYPLNATSNMSAYATGSGTSCINSNGSATIYATGGTGPYTYLWGTTPPQTTQTATNIPPGQYSFTVTDNTGCAVVGSSNINFSSYSFYVYGSTIAQPNCGNSNGSILADTYGGSPPYAYHWNDNQTTATAVGLGAGNHTVTVTDAGGCSTTGSVFLTTSCYNTISGKVFNDLNGNCIFDSTDTYMQGISVVASNGSATGYGYADYQGNYSILVHDTGTFTLQANSYYFGNGCGNLVSCGTSSATFHSFNNTATRNYGFVGSSGFDLATHPGWSTANPGFQKEIWILPFDQSTTPYTGNVTVTFVYDSNLIYQSSLPPLPAHNAAAHTLTWVLSSVPHPTFDWYNNRLRNFFMVPASLPINYLLQSDFYISPTTGDCDLSDNHLHFSEVVTGSHDPNEKTVSPAGNIFEDDSVLTYSIHFQNSGNDTTWFVIVKDTLDAHLDPATVRNLASSHPYKEFNISGTGVLTWVFNPIYLVDSATNEEASKGFVTFSIKKKSNLPFGSTISNKAHIYFDYNQPEVTNTVADTVADPNYIFEIRGFENVSVKAMPNPFSDKTIIEVNGLKQKFDFSLFDVTGRLMRKITSIETNRFAINRDDLPQGIYFYRISVEDKKAANGKLVVE